ncbi:hypothetical protein AGDE_13321 [Angomonas deanei]|nr:hypothetical protein AGDE_13321 [Angomonas deanei]|eukprot:EPY22497.1 hypothetical protein AGDE_13321 [Angomonas deanei]
MALYMELYPSLSLCHFWLVLYQVSMDDTIPVVRWDVPQTEVDTLQRENRELQAENRVLQGKLNDLLNEKMTWLNEKVTLVEEKSVLREERITLQNKYDNLRKEHDEQVEEHHDYAQEMSGMVREKDAQLDKALKDMEKLREEMEKQYRIMAKQESLKKKEKQREVLLDKFYDYRTRRLDLALLFNYCEAHRVPADVIEDTLTSDHRETLTIPDKLNSLVGDDNVKQFFETIVAALPNLKSITGYFTSIEDCYIQYKRGKVPQKVLEAYCAGIEDSQYILPECVINALNDAEQDISEFLSTVMPLYPFVTFVSVEVSDISTLAWCERLPERVSRVDICDCHHIQDCSPLLKMKGLKTVYFDSNTNASFDAVKEQLRSKGVHLFPHEVIE